METLYEHCGKTLGDLLQEQRELNENVKYFHDELGWFISVDERDEEFKEDMMALLETLRNMKFGSPEWRAIYRVLSNAQASYATR